MRAIYPILCALFLLLGASLAAGQTRSIVPGGSSKGFVTRKNGSGSGTGSSVGLVPAKKPPKRTITITYTVLSKEREWENREGKRIKARLLAFPTQGEQSGGETSGRESHFTVIQDGTVRFLMSQSNQAIAYPLNKLSDFDQEFIQEIAAAATRAQKQAAKKSQSGSQAESGKKPGEDSSAEKKK